MRTYYILYPHTNNKAATDFLKSKSIPSSGSRDKKLQSLHRHLALGKCAEFESDLRRIVNDFTEKRNKAAEIEDAVAQYRGLLRDVIFWNADSRTYEVRALMGFTHM